MIRYKLLKQFFPDYLFRKISYSQCGEDLITKVIFDNVLKIRQPSYLDIGAFHPFRFSNTYLFYKFGSRGINVEPNPDSLNIFKKYRPRDINLNIGIGTKSGVLEYHKMESNELNTFSFSEAQRMKSMEGIPIIDTLQIDVKTIEEVLKESGFERFPDFLSIDIEGNDLDILRTIDYRKSSPKVICVETIQFSKNSNARKKLDIITFLEGEDYYHYSDTMINSIFVKKDLIKDKFQELL